MSTPSAPASPAVAERPKLTELETRLLASIAAGHTNSRIARVLEVSVKTVEAHIHVLLGKLDAVNRTQAVTHAFEWGLLPLLDEVPGGRAAS